MNRTLKRPMFRIGGSAGTGITSGLDQPRKQYNQGTNPYAMGNFQSTGLPGFLTSFGLNLLATPPRGNIFSTAAIAAQDPFRRLQADQASATKTASDRAFSKELAEEEREFQKELLEEELKGKMDIAKLKQKDSFFAAQTPEEQFRERAKIYSESPIPVIKNNATDLATFEVKNRGENYVQLNFEYDKKTKRFEPDFRSVPAGALTYDPGRGIAYRMTRRDDGILVPIPLNPFTLEPIDTIDGTE